MAVNEEPAAMAKVRPNRCSSATKAEMPNPTVRGSRLIPASLVAMAMAPGRLSPAKMI